VDLEISNGHQEILFFMSQLRDIIKETGQYQEVKI